MARHRRQIRIDPRPVRPSEVSAPSTSDGPVIPPVRIFGFYVLIGLVFLVLVVRLVILQGIEGDKYLGLANENRQQLVNVAAPRGVIYDRNGVLLARNVPAFNITVTPAYLPDSEAQIEAIYRYLSALTGVPIGTADAKCRPGPGEKDPGIRALVCEGDSLAPYSSVIIKGDVPPEVAFLVRERQRELPGVGVSVTALREYPTGPLTAHLVGYMGPIPANLAEDFKALGFDPSRDRVGYAGVEATMQDVLSGRNGNKLIEEDVAGLEIRTIGEPTTPVPGNNIKLTIDVRLQAAAEAALRQRIEFINVYQNRTVTANGVVIAMNPQTGEILSLVSWPAYDNRKFSRFIPTKYYDELSKDIAKPLINIAISGQFPPGSVYKMAAAIGALEERVIAPERKLFDAGKITITNKYFPNDPGKARDFVCWKRDGHGWVDFITGIAQSCDVYFYKIGGGFPEDGVAGLGVDNLAKWAHNLGYGEKTAIELPGEAIGNVPTRDWKRINLGENWSTGDTYIATIGQGFVLSTPLQVLNSIASLANGGTVYQPTVIREVLDGEGNVVQPFAPKILKKVPASPANIRLVQRGLLEVVLSGTAHDYVDTDAIGVSVAGKTGTAEYCDNLAIQKNLCIPGNWPTHAWVVLYAPAENPEIAVIAFVYNGGEGAVTSGPIAAKVLQAYFDLKRIDAGTAGQ
ncbi:MAG: penicillin-binding protein 2 [Chloroflexi bacterium]|nr:penicillin-binding protein 2 [Chloroflexota bacterium]